MTGAVGWLDGILLMKLLSTKNRCATLLYNVQCTLYILRRICTHGLDSWGREIRILYSTCRDGGGGHSSYFSLIEYVYKHYMYRKEGPGRGGRL